MLLTSKSFVFILVLLFWTQVYGNITVTEHEENVDDDIIVEHGDNYTFLIIGGYRPKEHILAKHIVSIRRGRQRKFFGDNHICGGSIISENFVLTAGHCVLDEKDNLSNEEFMVVGGSPLLFEISSSTRAIKVKEIVVHPAFSMKTLVADFALMRTAEPFDENGMTLQRVPITDEKPSGGMKCISLGWGRIFAKGPKPDELIYIDLTMLKRLKCQEDFHMQPSLICAASDDPEKGLWKGDSGGPLICDGKLFGVVSFGKPTGGANFFSNVYEHRKWILANSAKKIKLTTQTAGFFSVLYFVKLYVLKIT